MYARASVRRKFQHMLIIYDVTDNIKIAKKVIEKLYKHKILKISIFLPLFDVWNVLQMNSKF